MDRYRLIASIVVLFIYLLIMYPWQTIITTIIIAVAYYIIRNTGTNYTESRDKAERRRNALKLASLYLAPYNNIWGNLKLSNKYCSLKLGRNAGSITGIDTYNKNRSFKITGSKVHSYDDLWNMFCVSFNHNTTFDELVQLANRFNAYITINVDDDYYDTTIDQKDIKKRSNNDYIQPETEKKDLLDVNNASEIELTALPGVSIVMAKKLIKRREEIGGFKSVQDVCLFLHLKPHMQNQLKKLICVNKMQGSIQVKRYQERNIDL